MAVTKQVYTASPTWSVTANLIGLFESAFIDAGLMTAWYDSFNSSGFHNRVLEVTYDASKTYGKTYYWFIFGGTNLGFHIASGWNATTHVPTGTQYLDYFSTATNTLSNHVTLATYSTTTTAELIRYTSGSSSWFVFRNTAAVYDFFIAPANTSLAPWIDLNKVMFHHYIDSLTTVTSTTSQTSYAQLTFRSLSALRRSYWAQGSMGSSTVNQSGARLHVLSYGAMGLGAGAISSDLNEVLVPYGFTSANPAYTSNTTPILAGYSYSRYVSSIMPSDFGLAFSYTTNTFSYGDRVIVTAGVEEWEVYAFANNTSNEAGSPLLLARVV